MNLTNDSINSTNENSLEAINSFDNKVNLHFSSKNRSDNALASNKCSKFNKSLINGMNNNSENNSKTSTSKKTLKIKKKRGITPIEKMNSENIDKIIVSKIKIFEALEKLLMNDNDNNNLNNNDNITKKRKNISIPKLDFSNIYNNYNRKLLYIKEVKYISKDNKENKNNNN